ncbi:MAG: FliM/FliN family flagellar motor switch protein [Phycisphaerae bacterium]|nr:FliM/FliN family flagellar motor switch protein [Phycisphaerae bacterium]
MAEEEKVETTEEAPAKAPAAEADAPAAQASEESPAEAAAETADASASAPSGQAEVYEAELPEAIEAISRARGGQIDVLLDTSMPVEVSLGSVELEVRELLQISPGSVITLDKQAGEPLDLYLKGIRFATAELVLADDKLGVRIKEILPRRKTDQTRSE